MRNINQEIGKSVIRFFLLLFGTLFFATFLTFVLPLLLFPLVIYRSFVQLVARLYRPDLSHILCGGDGVLALENPASPQTNIVSCFIIDGYISLEQLRSGVDKWVLQKKKKTPGTLLPLYPELKQYPWGTFMNYPFWTYEANFEIAEHVRIPMEKCAKNPKPKEKSPIPIKIATEDKLRQYIAKLLSDPWKREFSPWEFLLVNNYEGNRDKTVVICRFHHVLGDGITWTKILIPVLMNDIHEGAKCEMPQFTKPKQNNETGDKNADKKDTKFWKGLQFLSLLLLPVKLSYDVIQNTLESWDRSDEKSWNSARIQKTKKYFLALSKPFEVNLIKEIKNKMGVKYLTVLIAAVSGAVRRVMEEAGQRVPETMASYIAIPWPNHPEGIIFHAAGINITWPVGITDVKKRLDFIERNFSEKKSSLYPIFIFYGCKVQKYLPNVILRMIYKHVLLSTLITSHMPGPISSNRCFGQPILEAIFTCGLPVGNPGAFIAIFGCAGKQRVAMTIDQSLFPSDEAFQKLNGFIEDELIHLKDMKV